MSFSPSPDAKKVLSAAYNMGLVSDESVADLADYASSGNYAEFNALMSAVAAKLDGLKEAMS